VRSRRPGRPGPVSGCSGRPSAAARVRRRHEDIIDPDHFRLFAVLDAPGATPALLSPHVSDTDGNVVDSGWRWSPDGTRIAYRARPGATGAHDLFLVGADGGGLEQVTALPGDGWVSDIGWATDGSRYVWEEGDPDDGTYRIRSCDPSSIGPHDPRRRRRLAGRLDRLALLR
jgi:hypothetical protein